jgi:hypothetical protein
MNASVQEQKPSEAPPAAPDVKPDAQPSVDDEATKKAARKGVIERVRKYRALTASDNEHEAKIATKKAADLVAEHKITDAEIRGEAFTDVMEHAVDGDFSPAWRIALLTVISKSYHARAIRIREVVVKDGRPTDFWHGRVIALNQDINAIIYLFAYYESAVNEMVKVRGYDKATETEEDSYRRGLVYALQHRFMPPDKVATKVAQETTAISKTPETKKETASFVDKMYTNRHKNSDLGAVKDRRVFYDGVDDARTIPLAGIHRNKPRTTLESPVETPQENSKETP